MSLSRCDCQRKKQKEDSFLSSKKKSAAVSVEQVIAIEDFFQTNFAR